MTDPAQIAKSLSEAQKRALLAASVREPHSVMPTYRGVEVSMPDCSHEECDELIRLGIWTLPISLGGRYGGRKYSGEIYPFGLSVRAILEKETP